MLLLRAESYLPLQRAPAKAANDEKFMMQSSRHASQAALPAPGRASEMLHWHHAHAPGSVHPPGDGGGGAAAVRATDELTALKERLRMRVDNTI